MSDSRINLIDTQTKHSFPAAPTGTVLSSSIDLGWQGITVELHSLPASEYPEHYVQGHPLNPEDIADTATFLASDQRSWHAKRDRAKFISGEVVDVALGYNAAYTA